MSSDFDPYYKWLGIPPKDQPPHHYRLLGIECFEPDVDVIDAAANRVMGYLQDMSVGDQAEVSQRLLSEIAAARLCLLDSNKKDRYDASLRKKSDSPKRKPPVRREKPSTAPVAEEMPAATFTAIAPLPPQQVAQRRAPTESPATHAPRFDARRTRKRHNNHVAVAVMGVVILALLGTAYHLLTREGGTRNGKDNDRTAGATDAEKKTQARRKKQRIFKQFEEPSELPEFNLNDRPQFPVDQPNSDLKPAARETFDRWIADADRAIRDNRLGEAREILDRYLKFGDAPDQDRVGRLRAQVRFAQISPDEAASLLEQYDLSEDEVHLLKNNRLELPIEFTRPNLERAFYERLGRHVEERGRER